LNGPGFTNVPGVDPNLLAAGSNYDLWAGIPNYRCPAPCSNRVLKKSLFQADQKCPDARRPCLRRSGYAQAGEILRSEAYLGYAATTKDEGNAADGRFSAAC